MTNLIREPCAGGRFYPGKKSELEQMINLLVNREKESIQYYLSDYQIIGAVLPHAGYVYSGYQTIHFFEILKHYKGTFDTFIIIHPIHRGGYPDFASDESNEWRTILGDTKLDDEFIRALEVPLSAKLHEYEHSGEVILPFIQKYISYPIKIVPLGISRQNPVNAKEIAVKITNAVKKTRKRVCILASSDFSHYIEPEYGYKMDEKVVEKILKFDSQGVYREILEHDISVCGYGPIMTLMEYSKMNYPDGKVKIMARGHSGMVQPSANVVDYISILFYR